MNIQAKMLPMPGAGRVQIAPRNRHERRQAAALARQRTRTYERLRKEHFDWECDLAEKITAPAYDRVVSLLERHGNVLSEVHKRALYRACGLCTRVASGAVKQQNQGRRVRVAVSAGAGVGKSSGVVAWSSQAVHSETLSVAIASSRVADLCALRGGMLKQDVPEEHIGVVHSYGPRDLDDEGNPRASDPNDKLHSPKLFVPATENNDQRRVLLVTHNRVRNSLRPEDLMFQGKPRDLIIYDESLLVSEPRSLDEDDVHTSVGALEGYVKGREDASDSLTSALAFLQECCKAIDAEKRRQADDETERLLKMPLRDADTIDRYIKALPSGGRAAAQWETLRSFLPISQHPEVRYMPSNLGAGVITYRICIDPDLDNIVILDASAPIRELTQLDKSISYDDYDYSGLKSYEDVELRFWKNASGRMAMHKAFKRRNGKLSREAIEVLKKLPEDEAVAIFSFRPRIGCPNILEKFRANMRDHGLDPEQILENGTKRFRFVTWGRECATNEFADCRHTVFLGVLQRSDTDLAAAICGQKDDIKAEVTNTDIANVRLSEATHLVYQAAHRSIIRRTEYDRAPRATIHLFHHDDRIVGGLRENMPGLQVKAWNPVFHEKPRKGGRKSESGFKVRTEIEAHLRRLPEDRREISTKRLKVEAGLEHVPPRSFTRARDAAAKAAGWVVRRRTLFRE